MSDSHITPVLGNSPPKPRFQHTHSYDANDSGQWLAPHTLHETRTLLPVPSTFAILIWNIDFSRDLAVHRPKTVLNHIQNILTPGPNTPLPPPTLILIQEFSTLCFQALLSHPFVRTTYDVTDISSSAWPRQGRYGTVTLIPKSISSNLSVFRTPFPNSKMGRDALYVDFEFSQPGSDPTDSEPRTIIIRVANTHLESLPGHGDVARPVQLRSVSQQLTCSSIHGGIVCGDMNAISPSDFDLPEQFGLSDAWDHNMMPPVETPSVSEGEPESGSPPTNQEASQADGHTWGYQPRSRYSPGRLDKILFVGGLRVEEVKRVGVGLEYKRPPGLQLGPKGRKIWASDHYGLLARFTVV
jgi:tyrosyl-DNA phosphodiesterase 2